MTVPFTTEQFLDVFAHDNVSMWPAQDVLLLLGIVVAVFLLTTTRSSTVTPPILSRTGSRFL